MRNGRKAKTIPDTTAAAAVPVSSSTRSATPTPENTSASRNATL